MCIRDSVVCKDAGRDLIQQTADLYDGAVFYGRRDPAADHEGRSEIMREFKGRVVTPGTAKAEAVVTHGGFNTLASLQKSLQFGDKTAKCNDQNNPDLYGKPLAGYALCLPQTIGSTTGGMVLYCACAMKRQPACMLFANPIDSRCV